MTDDIDKRLEQRFEGDERDGAVAAESEEQTSNSYMRSMNAWNVGSVKTEWNANTVYLPDALDERFDDEFDRLKYVLDRDITKDRYYKPLIIALGMERLERMEKEDVEAFLERMEREEVFDAEE